MAFHDGVDVQTYSDEYFVMRARMSIYDWLLAPTLVGPIVQTGVMPMHMYYDCGYRARKQDS